MKTASARRGGSVIGATNNGSRISTAAVAVSVSVLLLTMTQHPSVVAIVTPHQTHDSRTRSSNGRTTFYSPIRQLLLPTSHHATVIDKSPRTVCRYADEWIDADVELAFRAKKAKPKSRKRASSSSSSPNRRPLLLLSRAWLALREAVRTRLERCTVYVLECESGKYYVGSTADRKRRFREHFGRRGGGRRSGSKWTRRHRPIRVLREHRRIPSRYLLGTESRVTAECMLEFGVNNVRGGMFCSTRKYHVGDVNALTNFLGHYNDLSYAKVRRRLSETLPAAPSRQERQGRGRGRGDYYKRMSGKAGHIAADCPDRYKKTTLGP